MENQELYELCKATIDLNKQKYLLVKEKAELIIKNSIVDNNKIESTLDELLDILLFYENDESLNSYKMLCRYYFNINPRATVDYINFYRKQNDLDTLNNELKNRIDCFDEKDAITSEQLKKEIKTW